MGEAMVQALSLRKSQDVKWKPILIAEKHNVPQTKQLMVFGNLMMNTVFEEYEHRRYVVTSQIPLLMRILLRNMMNALPSWLFRV